MHAARRWGGPALPVLLGGLFAAWLYGWGVIHPASGGWLLQGDAAQHYVGSAFFLAEGWHWPPGAIHRFGEDVTSLVFTDAIPWVALLAKALGLPPGHQYFGLWMVASHSLAAGAGWLLLRRVGVGSPAALLCGSLFFTIAPMLLMRAYGHEALMGHFLILLALERALAPWRWAPWLALAAFTVGIHPYLALMVCVMGLFAAFAAVAEKAVSWSRLLLQGGVSALVLMALAWLAGYFVGSGEVSAKGHGFHSANLLTWLDPMNWRELMAASSGAAQAREWSAWLPGLPQATQGQYEGFAYLGAGALAAMGIAVVGARLAKEPPHRTGEVSPARWRLLWVASAVLAALAISARPSIGAWIAPPIPLGEFAEQLLGVFRASGRFIWPLGYLLMAVAFHRVARLRWGTAILWACLLLQVADLRGKLEELRLRFRAGPPGAEAVLTDPAWKAALAHCPNLHALSAIQPPPGWAALALVAAKANARFAPAPTARVPMAVYEARVVRTHELIALKAWQPGMVYVLAEPLTGGIALEQAIRDLQPHVQHRKMEGYDVVLQQPCR